MLLPFISGHTRHPPYSQDIASPRWLGMLNLSGMIPRMGVVVDKSP